MVDVRAVANWFLSRKSLTHKQIQKLCYYAQAWYCALYDGSPLFSDEIQAWVHGPVIPTLYPIYSDHRWEPIPKVAFDEGIFEEKVLNVLEAVYETYGKFTGDQLESLTHSEDPWIRARKDLKPWETSTATISCDSMRNYYSRKYEEAQND